MGIGSFPAKITKTCKAAFVRMIGGIKSHRIAVLALCMALAALLLIYTMVKPGNREAAGDTGSEARFVQEDFFLPDEPDFVPEVLLEKDPKNTWTEEDTRPFWTDPMEGNAEAWRRRIDEEIDKMLEPVP
ncbi:MAG: hypothetical protein LBJ31_10870 [Treponema sp.]|jgi:hypothetical protein|nr:hypothetical protein [Treponema sp.]